jgi:hypothetical protein
MLFIYVVAGLLTWLIFPPSRIKQWQEWKNLKSDTVAGTVAELNGIPFSFTMLKHGKHHHGSKLWILFGSPIFLQEME